MKKLLLVLLMLVSIPVWSQNMLTKETNLMRDSDNITLQPVAFSYPGNNGKSVVWDFSNVDVSNEDHNINFSVDSLKHFHKIEDGEISSYVLCNNKLEQYKIENRLLKMKFAPRLLTMKYPLNYGDSISSSFDGYGRYCGNHVVRVSGQVSLEIDGEGSLILSKKDTLNNVLRVYTLTTKAMAVDFDYAVIDSTKLKQEIEEKYEWYARGYRYPVYTIIQRTSFSNLQPVGTTRYAYRLLPENYAVPHDAPNDSILSRDSLQSVLANARNDNFFHYHVMLDNSFVNVDYISDRDVHITALLSNSMGILYCRQNVTAKAGSQSAISFSSAGLPRGQYVVYLNVSGKIYSKTVNI